MNYIFYLLASFSLAFLIKQSDGPFGIIAWLRNKLMLNKIIGVFSYKLLSCWHCIGFHSSWIIYLIMTPFNEFNIRSFIIYSLAGAAFCYIAAAILEKIQSDNA